MTFVTKVKFDEKERETLEKRCLIISQVIDTLGNKGMYRASFDGEIYSVAELEDIMLDLVNFVNSD